MVRSTLVVVGFVLALAMTVMLAVPAFAANPPAVVTLTISGGFNMKAWASPAMYNTAVSQSTQVDTLYGPAYPGGEPNGYATNLFNYGGNVDRLCAVTTVSDSAGIISYNGTYLTGSQGTPRNGVLASTAYGALGGVYNIASIQGNASMPYDSIDMKNAACVGNYYNTGTWSVSQVTLPVAQGYYTDIDFVMTTQNSNYCQIWAKYSDTTSTKLYDFGASKGPNVFSASPTSTYTGFNTVYHSTWYLYEHGMYFRTDAANLLNLYEFSTPLTLNPAKKLLSIVMIDTIASINYNANCPELGIFAATARPVSFPLTMAASPVAGGTVAATPSQSGYLYGDVVTISETKNTGYNFVCWTATGGTISNSTAQTTSLTITSSCTVTASYSQIPSNYTVTLYQSANGTVGYTPSQATYAPGSVVTLSYTANTGFTFVGWMVTGSAVLSNSSVVSATMTINGNCSLTALYSGLSPLQISSGFNMNAWVSPAMFNKALAQSTQVDTLYVGEQNGYSLNLRNDGGNCCGLGAVTTVSDSAGPVGYNGTYLTGSQGSPRNGILTGSGGRTYCIASVSGNALMPYDSIDRSNAAVIGQTNYIYTWDVAQVTLPVPVTYYSDINFVLATANANYCQIWAVYADSSSTLLYDFGTTSGPAFGSSSVTSAFPGFSTLFHSTQYLYDHGMYFRTDAQDLLNLYEFSTPLTLNSAKPLQSIALINTIASVNYSGHPPEMAVFAATARGVFDAGNLTLTTSISPPGAGAVTWLPRLLTYTPSSVVTVQASAISGYGFSYWSVTGGGVLSNSTAATTSLTIYSSCSLTAMFVPAYTGTESATGGTIQLTSNGPYTYNQIVGITASPNAGWQFVNWTATNATISNSTAATTSLTVLGSFDLTALFSLSPYSVTTAVLPSPANGTVAYQPVSGPYYYGNVLQIQAYPATGYQFVGWTATGANLGANVASTTATVTNNVSLTASFTPAQYTVTLNQTTGGNASVSPSQAKYYYGNTATVTATASSGYGLGSWNVTNGTVSPLTSSVATLTVQGNVTLSANFDATGSLTIVTSQGTVTVTPSQAGYVGGTVVTITTSTVNAGYVLDHWNLSGGSLISNSCALTTQLTINGNTTLTAVYVTGSYVNNLNPLASDSNPGTLARPFLTVNKATSIAKAGATTVVLQGVYREAPSLTNSGTFANPIVVKGNPGDRVVVTGADAIPTSSGSWTQCTATTASGNANYANIYYTDISWEPVQVWQDDAPLTLAQTPNSAWWVPNAVATPSTLVDTVNLTQTYYKGGSIYMFRYDGTMQYWDVIGGYDAASHTLSIDAPPWGGAWSQTWSPTPTGCRYYIANLVQLMGTPGQWVVAHSGSNYRVFVWPIGGGRPAGHLFEAGRRNRFVFEWGNLSNWVFDGLEVRGSNGHGFGNFNGYTPSNNVVRNCVIHDNGGSGIYALGNTGDTFLHNVITWNGWGLGPLDDDSIGDGFGICVGSPLFSPSSGIIENEIAFSYDDNIYGGLSSVSISGNYIHDAWWGEHPDNIQDGGNASQFWLYNNLVFSGPDGIQENSGSNTNFINNTFLGIEGYVLQGEYVSAVLKHNTFLFAGFGCYATVYSGITASNNLADVGFAGEAFGVGTQAQGYFSDYNLFYQMPGTSSTGVVIFNGSNSLTFSQYVASSSQDTHSAYGDPKFANAPYYFQPVGFNFTLANRVYVQDASNMVVGDYIELGFDGVSRQITGVGANTNSYYFFYPGSPNSYVDFTPSDAKFSFGMFSRNLVNWKNNHSTSRSMDLTLQAGSPAIGAASDGGNMGSSIKIMDYMAGKLNGHTTRVLPTWPITPANVTAWAASTTTQGFNTITEGQTLSSPNDLVKGFKVTVDSALSGPTVNTSAISIVDTGGTSYAGYITSAALDSTARILTVTLNSSLPTSKTYIIALNPAVTAANGGPVLGAKSIKIVDN